MNQLTSDAASVLLYYVRSPWVNIFSIPGITNEVLVLFFTMLTADHSSNTSFYICTTICLEPSGVYLAVIRLFFGYALLVFCNRGKDFNFLDNIPAMRVYCEYKTQERIHRHIADWRLLAIPAS